MEDATHSPSVFSQGLTRRPPGRISNGSPGYWPCVAREGVEARISPKSVPCTDLAICWGAFVGWDAIFDFRSSIRSTDLGKHQCFRAEFQAASIPLKYHGVRLFSYDFKECHAWYHPGTPPKKPSLKLMFIETSIFHVKVLNHSIKTTIYKWMFQVPGWYLIFQLWVLYSSPPPCFLPHSLSNPRKNPMLSQAILNTTAPCRCFYLGMQWELVLVHMKSAICFGAKFYVQLWRFLCQICQEQKIENCQEYDGIKKWSQMNVAWW